MVTRTIFILLVAFFTSSLAAPTIRTPSEPETKYCVQVHTPPSACVDPPVFKHEGSDFCPFHMCAPKYVQADLCPADPDLQANAKCYEEEITRDVYKCDNIFTKTRYEPVGCAVGTKGCNEIKYCSCMKIDQVSSNQLKFITFFKPHCNFE